MTTHSSILAWRIPWTEKPRGLQSMGVTRVGHDLETKTITITFFFLRDLSDRQGWDLNSGPPNSRSWGIPHSSVGKEYPATQETQVQFLDWEDPQEKAMAIHSSVLAWKIPWMEEPGRLQSMGLQESDRT